MITVILVRPGTPGNIGAVARAMANFGLRELVLVEPSCSHLSKEALDRASHAKPILKKAKTMEWDEIKKLGTLAATTARLGTDYNIPRIPVTPEQLAAKISSRTRIAVVFGPEDRGLSNREVSECDFVVSIPSSSKYSTLNISHAAAILFYEMSKSRDSVKLQKRFTPSTAKEKEIMLKSLDNILNKLDFAAPSKKQTQRIVWKRIIGKAMPTKREAFAVIGFLKKVVAKMK